jgi:probable rRNA maturation factor
LSIKIFYDNTKYRFLGLRKAKKIIEEVIRNEFKITGDLNIIITNDTTLREINIQFLKHDYNTDVIAFDYNDGNIISGEIYISIDTVKRNAKEYSVHLKEEVLRVIIHGVLHLLGFDDKSMIEAEKMHCLEDFWLAKIRSNNGFSL